MSRTCCAVSPATVFPGCTTTATPSMAKGKETRPYFATSSADRARPVLPICTSPSPTCWTPTPEPPPATVIRSSGFAVMMRLAASFMTGMCAVPPAMSMVPLRPVKRGQSVGPDG